MAVYINGVLQGGGGGFDGGTLAELNAIITDLMPTYGGIRDIGIGDLADRPVSTAADKFFYTTDENKLYHYTGSAWALLAVDALAVSYDNTVSGLAATNVQDAIDEVGGDKLLADTTIDFDNTMTVAEMNALIDAVPEDLNGFALTLQFANGTYTLNDYINIQRFYGSGYVLVSGDQSQFFPTTNQNVILDFSSSTQFTSLNIVQCPAKVLVSKLRVKTNSANNMEGVTAQDAFIQVSECYFEGNGFTASHTAAGVRTANNAQASISACYFSNLDSCVVAQFNSSTFLSANTSTGTLPKYGYVAEETYVKYYNAVPSASVESLYVIGNGTFNTAAEYAFYDNTISGLTATNVQDAIDEVSRTFVTDVTVNVANDTTMNAADRKALLESYNGYNTGQYSLVFQLEDGVHTLDDWIDLRVQGKVRILGNSADFGLLTPKSVIVNMSNTTQYIGIWAVGNLELDIRFIKFTYDTFMTCINSDARVTTVTWNHFEYLAADGNGTAINITAGVATVWENLFEGLADSAIRSFRALVYSNNNDNTGVLPEFGLRTDGAGMIGKRSTQPSGSIANESVANGGEIR